MTVFYITVGASRPLTPRPFLYVHRDRRGRYNYGVFPHAFKIWDSNSSGYKQGKRSASSIKDTYHGHFNSEIFEQWLCELCDIATKQFGRECFIIMDGCRSHKRKVEKPPDATDTKAVMLKWLKDHKIPLPTHPTKREPSRVQLLEKIKEVKDEYTRFASWDIARDHGGHHILLTPPYHPELQPIERLWAVLKNTFADLDKSEELKKDMKWTISKLQEIWSDEITENTVKGAWEKMLGSLQAFIENADVHVRLRPDAEGDGEGASDVDSDDEDDSEEESSYA